MQSKTRCLMFSALVACAARIDAQDLTDRLHLSAGFGPAFQQDMNIPQGEQAMNFNTGVRGEVELSYDFTPWLVAGLETGAIWSSVDSIGGVTMSSYGGSLDLFQIPLMANVVFTTHSWKRLRPYAGGGLGCVFGLLDFNSPLGNIEDVDTTLAFQALAGVRYEISDRLELGLGYKYLATQSHAWSQDGVALYTEGSGIHSVTCSLTWRF